MDNVVNLAHAAELGWVMNGVLASYVATNNRIFIDLLELNFFY
jgi:hypothetical protein